jgi:hypothetical protein
MVKVGDTVVINGKTMEVTKVHCVDLEDGQVEARAVLDNRRGRPMAGRGATAQKAMGALTQRLGLK